MLPNFGHFLASFVFGRHIIGTVLLVTYVITAAGVPLPSGNQAHTDELYPCANCPCGCASAEQCWRSCCCHTLAERFESAREHHVRPPEYAIAAARAAGIDLCWLGITTHRKSEATTPSCCQRVADGSLPPCCQKRATATCCHEERACCQHTYNRQQTSPRTDHVIVWRTLACQGQSLNWLAAVPTLFKARPAFSHHLPLIAWLGPAASEAADHTIARPDVPPPERA